MRPDWTVKYGERFSHVTWGHSVLTHFKPTYPHRPSNENQLTLQPADVDSAVEEAVRAKGKPQDRDHRKISTFRGPRAILGELSPTQAAGKDITHRQKLDHVLAPVLDLRCVNKS